MSRLQGPPEANHDIDVDKLLDLDRSIEDGAIRHPSYDIGKWYWREIVQTGVVLARKPLRRFTVAERERLLWADDVRIEKVHRARRTRGTSNPDVLLVDNKIGRVVPLGGPWGGGSGTCGHEASSSLIGTTET